jgi:hypothetical protein
MKTLYESLLSDIEDTIANGEDDIKKALNIPTVKDFVKNPYNSKQTSAKWICPRIVEKYKTKYPDMVIDKWTGFEFMLDTYNSRMTDLHIYLTDSTEFLSHKKVLPGWCDTFTGANLRTYKKMTIDIIEAIAKKPELLDKVMEHSYKAFKSNKQMSYLTDVYSLYSLATKNKLEQ